MQKWIQPPAFSVHGLHRILSSYWLAHFYLMKKPAKVLLYFGLDCGMMKFFTLKPQSKGQLMSLPHLWNTVWRKRSRLEHMQTVNRTSRRIGFNSAWNGSGLWSLLKYSRVKKKIKNLKRLIFQWYHSHADPIWPDSTFKYGPRILLKVVSSEKVCGSGVTSTLGTWYGGVVMGVLLSFNEAAILYRDFNSAPTQKQNIIVFAANNSMCCECHVSPTILL